MVLHRTVSRILVTARLRKEFNAKEIEAINSTKIKGCITQA